MNHKKYLSALLIPLGCFALFCLFFLFYRTKPENETGKAALSADRLLTPFEKTQKLAENLEKMVKGKLEPSQENLLELVAPEIDIYTICQSLLGKLFIQARPEEKEAFTQTLLEISGIQFAPLLTWFASKQDVEILAGKGELDLKGSYALTRLIIRMPDQSEIELLLTWHECRPEMDWKIYEVTFAGSNVNQMLARIWSKQIEGKTLEAFRQELVNEVSA